MAAKSYRIEQYATFLMKQTLNYAERKSVPTMAQIKCWPTDTTDFSYVCFVFVDGEEIPQNFVSASGIPYAFISSRFYSIYLDLLRNEKPVRFVLLNESGTCRLDTQHREPVGEGPGEGG